RGSQGALSLPKGRNTGIQDCRKAGWKEEGAGSKDPAYMRNLSDDRATAGTTERRGLSFDDFPGRSAVVHQELHDLVEPGRLGRIEYGPAVRVRDVEIDTVLDGDL